MIESNVIEEITEDTIELIKNNLIKDFEIYFVDNNTFTSSLVLTVNEMISKTKVLTKEQAVLKYIKNSDQRPSTPKLTHLVL